MNNILVLIIATLIAKISHNRYSKNEPTVATFLRNTGYLFAVASAGIFSSSANAGCSVASILVYVSAYLTTLLFFIVLYRGSSRHPLASFPGPRLAKYSQLVHLWWHVKGNTRLELQGLHRRYGDVVRIGPNSLSFADVAAVSDIHGAKGLTKGPAYLSAFQTNAISMLSIQTHAEHAQRRRIWDHAFGQKALQGYQDHLRRLSAQFVEALGSNLENPIDLHLWFGYLTYDVMSEIAFSGGKNLLKNDAQALKKVALTQKALTVVNTLRAIPWIVPYLEMIPKSDDVKEFRRSSAELFQNRLRKGRSMARTDIFYWLLGEDKDGGNGLSDAELRAECNFVVAAGADTSRTTFTSFFYYILRDKGAYERLQTAVDALSDDEAEDFTVLANLPILEAYIEETLRLSPSVASGMQRTTRGEGATIAGVYVPEGTQVIVPQYVLHRDPRYFDRPDEFRPDRWLNPEGETKFERKAFFPFSTGPYGCVGKQLALQELRYVIVALLRNFRFDFAVDFEKGFKEGFVERYEDRFLMAVKEPLKVIVTARSSSAGA